jgi:hypothetical protein
LVEKLCLDDTIIQTYYKSVFAPAEYYYYTYIQYLQLDNEIRTTPNLSNDATTFTNWGDMGYTYESGYGLKNYTSIEKEELLYLLHSKCLFGRKFTKKCYPYLYIQEYIENIESRS